MIDIKNEKEAINKEVELIQHELSNNSKYAHSDQYKLNEKLNSLEKRGWDLYHSEGMEGGGWNADKTLHTVKDDGFMESLYQFHRREPKNYKRRMNNSENFATIYMGDKKFIWIEKSNNFANNFFNKLKNIFKISK